MMSKFLIICCNTILILFSTTSLVFGAEIPAKIESFVNELEVEKGKLQGGAIAILYRGQVVYKTVFGNKKGDTGPITSNTLFPLASVSKAVSASAVALLVDKGQLNLNEKFKLPYLKNPVNLTNILSHTTGYNFSGNAEIEKGLSRKALLLELAKQKPKCQPDNCFRYSNTTFSLVEEVLNRKKYSLQLVIDDLNRELKTKDIQILPLAEGADIAYPHSRRIKDGVEIIKPMPFPPYYPKTTPASAGVFASIDSMIEVFKLSFGYRPDLISQKTLEIMQTPLKSTVDIVHSDDVDWPDDKKKIESHYAIGMRLLKIKGQPGKDLLFHPGWIGGINSFMGYVPSEEMGIIILLNQRSRFPFEKGVKFWGAVLKG